MTDSNETTPATDEDVTIVATTVADEEGILAEGAVAIQGDHALVVARFADTEAARALYDDLLMAEIDGSLHIDSVLVVKADDNGKLHVEKMTDHSTRTGLKWGIVGGVVAAVFLPATIVAGAVALGAAGAAAGKARNLAHRLDVEQAAWRASSRAGTSGILALVTARTRPAVEAKAAERRGSQDRSPSTTRRPTPSRKPRPRSRRLLRPAAVLGGSPPTTRLEPGPATVRAPSCQDVASDARSARGVAQDACTVAGRPESPPDRPFLASDATTWPSPGPIIAFETSLDLVGRSGPWRRCMRLTQSRFPLRPWAGTRMRDIATARPHPSRHRARS